MTAVCGGGATFGYTESAPQVESQAFLNGLRWAAQPNIASLMILSDSHHLVDMLQEVRSIEVQIR